MWTDCMFLIIARELGLIITATSSPLLLPLSMFFCGLDRKTVPTELEKCSCLYRESNLFIFHWFTLIECQLCAASMAALSQ